MSAVVIIPARYGSTRFAAKILAAETGRPLVQHVVDQVRQCRRVREVVVATDDQRIVAALTPFGTRCVMTDPNHKSGTDRVAEAASQLDGGLADDILVNVQGDEPEIEPHIIDDLIDLMEQGSHAMATAATPFPKDADPADPNLVKVVTASDGRAIYFSRSPIPFPRDGVPPHYLLHLGLYTFRRAALMQFVAQPPTPLEQTEKLEQLRALEIGLPIQVLATARATHGIDTAEQYADFVRRMRAKKATVEAMKS